MTESTRCSICVLRAHKKCTSHGLERPQEATRFQLTDQLSSTCWLLGSSQGVTQYGSPAPSIVKSPCITLRLTLKSSDSPQRARTHLHEPVDLGWLLWRGFGTGSVTLPSPSKEGSPTRVGSGLTKDRVRAYTVHQTSH